MSAFTLSPDTSTIDQFLSLIWQKTSRPSLSRLGSLLYIRTNPLASLSCCGQSSVLYAVSFSVVDTWKHFPPSFPLTVTDTCHGFWCLDTRELCYIYITAICVQQPTVPALLSTIFNHSSLFFFIPFMRSCFFFWPVGEICFLVSLHLFFLIWNSLHMWTLPIISRWDNLNDCSLVVPLFYSFLSQNWKKLIL